MRLAMLYQKLERDVSLQNIFYQKDPVLIDAFVQISFWYSVQIFMKYHKSRFVRKSILQR